jgi:hypothetical protein
VTGRRGDWEKIGIKLETRKIIFGNKPLD